MRYVSMSITSASLRLFSLVSFQPQFLFLSSLLVSFSSAKLWTFFDFIPAQWGDERLALKK